ncbi:SMI1/KNR4 family protein [Streptomyces sp. NPDC005538]|uniref:SMI1/KNR4 family protein n=1 Tax=unclassified Streptomyces TaxID=2593676 RepID=UPI0033A0EBAE
MNPELEGLIALLGVGEPFVGRQVTDWGQVESRLGHALPRDYQNLIGELGGGRIDGYLWLLEPDCPNQNYDLVTTGRDQAEILAELWEAGEERPAELVNSGAQLFPWAVTDNGECLYWFVQPGVSADGWTIAVNEARGSDWEFFPSGCVAFLNGILSRAVESEILWSKFPTEPHEFRRSATFL